MADHDQTVRLTADEAFVLYDLAHRVILDQDADHHAGLFVDHGEWHALSSLLSGLETQLVEIFMPDYHARLRAARQRLRCDDSHGITDWQDGLPTAE